MPTYSYGPTVEARAIRLLRALLLFANWEIENPDHFDIRCSWSDEHSSRPKLMVKTKLRTLADLVNHDDQEERLSKDQIWISLTQMKKFLKILEDHRMGGKGLPEWHFTLTLWSREIQKNLDIFHQEWQRRKSELSPEQDTEISPPPQIIHNLPRSGVIKFVGREDILETLHQQLQKTERVAISAVTGMGGIGKTELALQYSQQHCKDKTYLGGICWLQARGENLGTQILSFAKSINLNPPEDDDLETQIAYCWQNWPILPNPASGKSDVLLIFDDVWEYKAIEKFLPSHPRFKILVTTRRKWLAESFKSLKLEVLSESEALELLASFIEKNRIEQEPEQAQLLCKDLGYLPLGLELVGRYLKRKSKLSLAQMREQLNLAHNSLQKKDRKGETFLDMTAERGVEAAFELSWQELDEEEIEVACLLSLFALAPIEWEWVEQSLSQQDAQDLEEIRDDVLVNLSLLQEREKNTYQLHHLIREFLIGKREKRDSTNQIKQGFCQTLVTIAQRIPETPTRQQILDITPVIPHLTGVAESLTEYVSDDDLVWPFIALDRFYSGQGFYNEAEPWNKQCLEICRNRLGQEHLDVARSLNNLAELYRSQGKNGEAEPLLKQALEMYKKLLGPEQTKNKSYSLRKNWSFRLRRIHVALNNLALLYKSQGSYREAKPLYKQALEMQKKLLEQEHPDVASSLNNLALLYKSQGRYGEAEPLLKQALEMQKKLLGQEHPDVASSLNNLAVLHYSQRRYGEVEPLLKQALEMRQKLLGQEHPDVAISLDNLAALYSSQGRYEEAEPLHKQALEMFKKLLGQEHPHTQIVLKNLQRCLQKKNSSSQ